MRVRRKPWISHSSREANFTGMIRAPSADVTATPIRGLGGVPANCSSVSRQKRQKSPRRVIGGRVARAAAAVAAGAGVVES